MESLGGFSFSDMNQTVRKKRSDRRPRNDVQPEYHGNSSLSSSSPSNNGSTGLSDDNVGHNTNHHRKILKLDQCNSRASYTNLTDVEKALNVSSEFGTQESSDGKDTGVGTSEVFASNYKDTKYDTSTSNDRKSKPLEVDSDAEGVDNVVKKVKLKVGGVVRTIHAKPSSDAVSVSKSSIFEPRHHSTSSHLKHRMIARENLDEDYCCAQNEGTGLRGIPWKAFSRSSFFVGKIDSSRRTPTEESICIKNSDKHESVRKSKRVPKRRLDDVDSDDEDDAEMRYLEKIKLKTAKGYEEDEGGSKKQRKISSVLKMEGIDSSRLDKERKKSKTGRVSEDADYMEEEERVSDGEPQFKLKKLRKDRVDMSGEDSGREMAVTTRRQALQSGRDISSDSTASIVEFPNGLPPAPPRKQKDKLSEVEHQLKKAEAAQRRKMQAAKAAQESEAEAIRKILGQESSRKKRENKMKQRHEELAQERTSKDLTLASNTVRWVIGPTGTVVTFSDDIGLPNIFESRPCSYPPPREKCAGPSCSKPFKYRDSRSKLPLCSLHCYKAVKEKTQPGAVC